MDKFQNKYRIPTCRLQGFDYGANRWYFVTICTKDRKCYFGKIENGTGVETDVETDNHPSLRNAPPEHIAANVETDNHPSLRNALSEHIAANVETDDYPSPPMPSPPMPSPRDTLLPRIVRKTKIGEIAEAFWLDIPNHFPFVVLDRFVVMPNHVHGILLFDKDDAPWQPSAFGRQSRNLGAVIRGFKSSLKRYAAEHQIDFAWQDRFYDSIIRGDDGLCGVREYISNNPQNWGDDELYTT
ncbi:MAG: hypothetical protein FWG50_11530 [Kiritimatiellaeota bacterium]|nr:hypothetical protein [Kiritimatiellota bacterium]